MLQVGRITSLQMTITPWNQSPKRAYIFVQIDKVGTVEMLKLAIKHKWNVSEQRAIQLQPENIKTIWILKKLFASPDLYFPLFIDNIL